MCTRSPDEMVVALGTTSLHSLQALKVDFEFALSHMVPWPWQPDSFECMIPSEAWLSGQRVCRGKFGQTASLSNRMLTSRSEYWHMTISLWLKSQMW